MAFLIFSLDDGERMELQIVAALIIGSSPDSDLIVEGVEVAAHHAEVYPDAHGNCWVRDLGSALGISVNNRRTTFKQLRHGDELLCGQLHAQFLDHLNDEPMGNIIGHAETSRQPAIDSAELPILAPPVFTSEIPVPISNPTATQKLEEKAVENTRPPAVVPSIPEADIGSIPAVQQGQRSGVKTLVLVTLANAALFTAGFAWLYYKTKYDFEIKLGQFGSGNPVMVEEPNKELQELHRQIPLLIQAQEANLKKYSVADDKLNALSQQMADMVSKENERIVDVKKYSVAEDKLNTLSQQMADMVSRENERIVTEQKISELKKAELAKELEKPVPPPPVIVQAPPPVNLEAIPLEKSEMILLKERNRLTGLADEAIATGSRAAYERLWDTFEDPRLSSLIHAARAEIMRVQDCYLKGQRATYYGIKQHKIPIADIFPDTPLLTPEQLSEAQIIEILQNQKQQWQTRVKAAWLLGQHRSAKSGEALMEAIKNDPMLDVVAEATFSFDQITGYHARLFEVAPLLEWWNAYNKNPASAKSDQKSTDDEQPAVKNGGQ